MSPRIRLRLTISAVLLAVMAACTSLPETKVERHRFPPKELARFGKPDRPYEVLGVVRSKVNFQTLISSYDERYLCANYFNKAVGDLVRMAKDKGADAVIEVKSVTFLMDGNMEMYEEPQCFDDGEEGQVLARGTAIKWKPEEEGTRASAGTRGKPAPEPREQGPENFEEIER